MHKIIAHFVRKDKRRRITIYRRDDGFFTYTIDAYFIEDIPEYQHYTEYWHSNGLDFGIYDSDSTAIREASVTNPWILTVTPDQPT